MDAAVAQRISFHRAFKTLLGRTSRRGFVWSDWLSVWIAVLFSVFIGNSLAQTQSTTTSSTKKAYIKIARSHATGLTAEAKQASVQMDMAQTQAAKKSLFADLRAMGEVDSELKGIIDDFDQSEDDLVAIIQKMEEMPQPPNALVHGLQNFYYGATGQFGAADDYNKSVENQSTEVRTLLRKMLHAMTKNETALLMLPRVAKKLAGPAMQESNLVSVAISEPWGFSGPDRLTLVNRSDRDLHNCTVVVFLSGKTGEVKQNVHFVETWPEGGTLYAEYQPGQKILDQMAFRQTVTLIQRAEIEIYCDEFTHEGIGYQYAGANRDRDIGSYLDKYFKPSCRYRPFSKGLVFDDERAMNVSFSGLQYLPPGTLVFTLKNAESSTAYRWKFETWPSDKSQWIKLNNLNWDPTEYTIEFQFDDTSVTRLHRWTR